MNRVVLQELGAVILLLASGIAMVLLAPESRLPYIVGTALLFAAVASLIDLIQSPGEPPHQLAIAVVTAAGILVGGW